MAKLEGTSIEMERQAKLLSDADLAEIADTEGVASRKAKAELARRQSEANATMLCWTRIAGVAAIVAAAAALWVIFAPWFSQN